MQLLRDAHELLSDEGVADRLAGRRVIGQLDHDLFAEREPRARRQRAPVYAHERDILTGRPRRDGMPLRLQALDLLQAVEAERRQRAAMVLRVVVLVTDDAQARDSGLVYGPFGHAARRDIDLMNGPADR